MISAVIVTKNAAKVLDKCLKSVKDFAEEIIIIDLESHDETKDIAMKYGANLFTHPPVVYVELVRQYAINKATGDWIILLDPDEQLSPRLIESLKRVDTSYYSAVNIPRKNIFFGKWVRHTNFWPDRQIRYFQKSNIKWPEKIHTYPKINGNILDLPQDEDQSILHFGYDNFHEFFERQNRYSEVESNNLLNEGYVFNPFNIFWMPIREFLVRYIRHLGFLDGFLGLSLVYALMIYKLTVQIKLWEKSKA